MGTVETLTVPALGWELHLDRVAFRIGNFSFYWYGILIAIGFALAIFYVFRRAKTFGLNEDRMVDIIFGAVIGGIVGARLYYVAFRWDYYSQNLGEVFNTRNGGLAIYGGILFGFAAGYLMCRWRRVKFLPMADAVTGGFFIGQAMGRWGNFVNIEAFGANTSLPWGMSSPVITQYLTAHEQELEAMGSLPCFTPAGMAWGVCLLKACVQTAWLLGIRAFGFPRCWLRYWQFRPLGYGFLSAVK